MPFVGTTVKVLLAAYGTYVSHKLTVAVIRSFQSCDKKQATRAGIVRNASQQRSSDILDLLDDLMYIIFAKL
jgi:hypothetical protein